MKIEKTEKMNDAIQMKVGLEISEGGEIKKIRDALIAFDEADAAFEVSVDKIANQTGWDRGKIIREIASRRLALVGVSHGVVAVNAVISDAKQLMSETIVKSVDGAQ